jgi:hypothetical protein
LPAEDALLIEHKNGKMTLPAKVLPNLRAFQELVNHLLRFAPHAHYETILENLATRTSFEQEVQPPWIQFPNYSPADPFWRMGAYEWYQYQWRPYWNSLSDDEKKDYLNRWQAPEEWRNFCPDINIYWSRSLTSQNTDIDEQTNARVL